jgi:prepilin-type N-terminal cleavage/methylation domain-containing protein
MMKRSLERSCYATEGGFTLLEVMVSLILGALVLGGLMGLISVSLQYSQRIKERSHVQPLLESLAQEILANPEKAVTGSLTLASEPGAPRVNVLYAREELPDLKGMVSHPAELYRVMLECRGQVLEFSLYVTPTDTGKTDELSG